MSSNRSSVSTDELMGSTRRGTSDGGTPRSSPSRNGGGGDIDSSGAVYEAESPIDVGSHGFDEEDFDDANEADVM